MSHLKRLWLDVYLGGLSRHDADDDNTERYTMDNSLQRLLDIYAKCANKPYKNVIYVSFKTMR